MTNTTYLSYGQYAIDIVIARHYDTDTVRFVTNPDDTHSTGTPQVPDADRIIAATFGKYARDGVKLTALLLAERRADIEREEREIKRKHTK